MNKISRIYHNAFNIKFAIPSAIFNGLIAAGINSSHGSLEAITAGGTQSASSFVSTGVTSRIVQHFSPIKNRLISYTLGSVVPATITFGLSYFGHWMNETPERLESCIAPTLISLTTSLATNFATRKGYMLPGNYHANHNA